MINNNKNSLITGAFLLILLIGYFFRDEFFRTLTDNYFIALDQLVPWIPRLIISLIIILIAHLLVISITTLLKKYLKYVGREKEYIFGRTVVRYVIWFLAIIAIVSVAMGNLGVWLTSLGLVGFGITFALQKPILNFVGWLTILFNRTYKIGDRIKVGNDRGDVKEIHVMYTVMDGLLENTDELSGKLVTIPNELVLTGSITNYTKTGFYLWDELSIDITYESDWKKAEQVLKDVAFKVVMKYIGLKKDYDARHTHLDETLDILKTHHQSTRGTHRETIEKNMNRIHEEKAMLKEHMDSAWENSKKEPIVRMNLSSSSITLNVRYLAHYKSLLSMKSEINTGFLTVISKLKNVEIAYPHIEIVTKGRR